MKVLFCRIGWCKNYDGSADDRPVNGGAFNKNHIGAEIHNFKDFNGKYYGFVEPGGSLHIERLGCAESDESIEDVLVVFVALKTKKERCSVIVGWYKHATIFRTLQKVPAEVMQKRTIKENDVFNLLADTQNSVLLSEEDRKYPIDGMGQKNFWYADKPEYTAQTERIIKYIEEH